MRPNSSIPSLVRCENSQLNRFVQKGSAPVTKTVPQDLAQRSSADSDRGSAFSFWGTPGVHTVSQTAGWTLGSVVHWLFGLGFQPGKAFEADMGKSCRLFSHSSIAAVESAAAFTKQPAFSMHFSSSGESLFSFLSDIGCLLHLFHCNAQTITQAFGFLEKLHSLFCGSGGMTLPL